MTRKQQAGLGQETGPSSRPETVLVRALMPLWAWLLYTSDAADDTFRVDFGGPWSTKQKSACHQKHASTALMIIDTFHTSERLVSSVG